MRTAIAPIESYGETGISMMSGNGTWHRCHPIFAIFIGDYPEQSLVTCTYNGRCPKCLVPSDQLGDFSRFPPRDHAEMIDVFSLADEDISRFHAACRDAGLKPVTHPFWQMLPLVNIFLSITPDVLHQLLQGVVRHLITWLRSPITFGQAEIDARCRSLPPNHHTRLFTNGISGLSGSRITGKEHKDICRILLGLVIQLPLPNGQAPSRLVKAVRALLDFVYLAQYPSHTTLTLYRLEESLARFHQNKDIFIDLGVRGHFNIPKLHSLLHYQSSISLFGTTDNYNTEQSERLHIDFTKDAYRATNHKDEYPQMTAWLERREKIQRHDAFIGWRQATGGQQSMPNYTLPTPIGPPQAHSRTLKMTRNPSVKKVTFDSLAENYGAIDFQDALADFIAQVTHPGTSASALRNWARNLLISFRAVPVYHKIKFTSSDSSLEPDIVDAVFVRPEQKDTHGRIIPSRFDTVLVRGKEEGQIHGTNGKHTSYIGLTLPNCYSGNRIAQVRVVFEIPHKVIQDLFPSPDMIPPTHLAYIEWFSPLSATPDPNHLMYRVSRLMHGGHHRAAIIPVESIICSVHLFPRFGPQCPHNWKSFSVLEKCNTFYVNPFSDRYNYLIFS